MSHVKVPHTLIETGFFTALGQSLRDGAENCLHTGVHDYTARCAAGDTGAQKAGVGQFQCRAVLNAHIGNRFFDRHGLPGKRRLAHEEILCREQPQVSRNDRAGMQKHDIARHDFRYPDFVFLPVAQNQSS